MADPRPTPYVHVSWLAKIMAGDVACQWQYWFQAHQRLTKKRAVMEFAGYQVDHTRMLSELRKELVAAGLRPHLEYTVRWMPPSGAATVHGKIDCWVMGDNGATVYECKSGQPHGYDQVQTMLYMYTLSHDGRARVDRVRGVLVYKDERCPLPPLPTSFESDIDYFVDLLTTETPPALEPGESCAYCNLTRADCPYRLDEPEPLP